MADVPMKNWASDLKNPSTQEDEVSEYPTVMMTSPGTSNEKESSAMDIYNPKVLASTRNQEIIEEPLLNVIPKQMSVSMTERDCQHMVPNGLPAQESVNLVSTV